MATGDLKVDRINGAYSKLRISGITVEPTPENLTLALGLLEGLMNELYEKNVCLGYNFEDEPDVNSKSGISPGKYNSVDAILALRLMPDFGKGFTPDQMLIGQAKAGSSHLFSSTADPNIPDYPARMPIGSGTSLRTYRYRKFYYPESQAPDSCDTKRMILDSDNPNIDDFVEHFDSYLADSESISSYTIEADTGLTVVSSSISDDDIIYRIRADGTDYTGSAVLQVKIVVTTDDSRVITRVIDFQLTEVD
jgi:hypothetical protein